ncbi:MAG: gluconate 2-dehydrogenase subunit 3 family protein [Gammaproteobacteria bacterium]
MPPASLPKLRQLGGCFSRLFKRFFNRRSSVQLPRRQFLKLTLGAALVAWSGYLVQRILWPSPLGKDELHSLAYFLDTLIPADQTPSATALDVDKKIAAAASLDHRLRRLIKTGCAWIDAQAEDHYGVENFSALSETERDHIVALAAAEKMETLPRVFFERLRQDAFSHYYAQPAAWIGLPYAGPPQPKGHLDFYLPPRTSS